MHKTLNPVLHSRVNSVKCCTSWVPERNTHLPITAKRQDFRRACHYPTPPDVILYPTCRIFASWMSRKNICFLQSHHSASERNATGGFVSIAGRSCHDFHYWFRFLTEIYYCLSCKCYYLIKEKSIEENWRNANIMSLRNIFLLYILSSDKIYNNIKYIIYNIQYIINILNNNNSNIIWYSYN